MPNQQVPLIGPTPETVTAVFESKISSHATSDKELDVPDSHSTVSDGGTSNRSVLSISSLRRRLHSKYSSSLLDDVQSLMGRLSVSSCSDVSSFSLHKPMRRPPPQFCTPFKTSQNFTLPGIFPRYLWNHISHNKLLCCDHIRLPCNRAPLFKLSGSGTHRLVSAEILLSIRTQTVRSDNLGVVDSFGNSILHIAAALGSEPKYLLSLILLGGNVHLLNNANQAFLHLVDVSAVAYIGDFRKLLAELAGSNFKFAQQDHNGQTAIHALTQEIVPWKTLSYIVHSFQLHDIPITECRDNLGTSIADQLQEKWFRLFIPDAQDHSTLPIVEDLPLLQLGPSSEIDIFPAWQQTLANGQLPDPVENLEYSHEYQIHADILRIILRSGEDPLFEDMEGRNGIHCLAEARLDLPLEVDENTTDSTRKLLVRRESYLDQPLSNGVCPNRYDKHGITPFMSFVIHNRAEEDDSSTTKLLSQLWQAGANINSRNSQGETTLHLTVKLGRRAATKFLLSHGANVHVRNYKGLGVLALGLIYSDRAAQDTVLYAQISLCICLVGSVGAVSTPTLLDEWVTPELKSQVGCVPQSGVSPGG
ncbi:hypothetical protein ACEPPN_016276 [Leptodophora sp. 'Broadleaf-Isolate-01']